MQTHYPGTQGPRAVRAMAGRHRQLRVHSIRSPSAHLPHVYFSFTSQHDGPLIQGAPKAQDGEERLDLLLEPHALCFPYSGLCFVIMGPCYFALSFSHPSPDQGCLER